MTTEQEYLALQNRLKLSEEAKRAFQEGKTEEALGLKPDVPMIVFDRKQLEGLESAARLAARNYVLGAMKTREQDMECFRGLIEEMGKIQHAIQGHNETSESLVSGIEQKIADVLAKIEDELSKHSAHVSREQTVLAKLDKVLDEYGS